MQNALTQILEAVGERMAQTTLETTRQGNTDYFDGRVTLDGRVYRVQVAWPDGAEVHELDPQIIERVY